MNRDPNARIRTTSVVALVALGMLARDLVRIYRWSGQASQMTAERNRQSAADLNNLEDRLTADHHARVAQLEHQVDTLLDRIQNGAPADVVVEAEPGDVDAA